MGLAEQGYKTARAPEVGYGVDKVKELSEQTDRVERTKWLGVVTSTDSEI